MQTLIIKTKPNCKEDKIVQKEDLIIAFIKAPAQDGQANKYLTSLLAKKLNIAKSLIQIDKKSQKSRIKRIYINHNSIDVDNLGLM